MDDSDTSMDLSWISAENRMLESKTMYTREPVTQLPVRLLFVSNGEEPRCIRRLHAASLSLASTDPCVSIDRIHHLVEGYQRRRPQYASYACVEMLLYHIPTDVHEIQVYSQSDSRTAAAHHMRSVWTPDSSLREIAIPSSIFVFHDINTLYCILEEPMPPLLDVDSHMDVASEGEEETEDMSDDEEVPDVPPPPLHPILKHTSRHKPALNQGVTKKVRINAMPQMIRPVVVPKRKPHGKKTRKYVPSKSINTTVH